MIARSKDIPSSTRLPGNSARKVFCYRSVSVGFLTSPATAPEKSLMSTTQLYSCRCWGTLQKIKKFYASPRSIYARRRMKIVSLKQPCNQLQEISCVPSTPSTMENCIGALVRRRDGDASVICIVDIGFCNMKI